ncbi:MAG: Stp1/IreP family PP2C-type Ser/Thr phosphatase [Planctomycetota bacterium]
MPEKGSIRISVAGTTDVGQVREHNEDNLLVVDLAAGERLGSGDTLSRELGGKGLLVAVADGMGGAASGELASEMAVDSVHDCASAGPIGEESEIDAVAVALTDCVTEANTRIFDKSQAESEHRGMGTTMTAAWGFGNQIAIAQVGDSRAYLLRKGKLVQVTKDQSLIEQLIQDGTLTEEEAERLGGRNIILQALGVEEGVDVETKTMEVLDGDLFVLCSDGLSGMVKDEAIEAAVADVTDPATELGPACAKLIQLANEGGGRDNITVILARFEGEGLRAPMQPLSAEEGAPAAPAFAAPEVPQAKTPRTKPAICAIGALVVAIVSFFLLTGSDGDVTFRFPAEGAAGELIEVDEVGQPVSGGRTFTLAPPEGEKAALVESVPDGRYRLTARHEKYATLTVDYEIDGGGEIDVEMLPLPGTVTLVPALARVTVKVHRKPAKESDVPWSNEVKFEAAKPRVLDKVPAGDLEITVSRPSFVSKTITAVLPPKGEATIELPELEPITGKLEVSGGAPGMEVRIADDWGEVVWSATMPEAGGLEARVRVGEHFLSATHEKFEAHEDEVKIVEGETFLLRIPAIEKRGMLLVTGPADGRVTVTGTGGSKWEKRQKIPAEGKIRFEHVPPGKYEVRCELPDRPAAHEIVTVEAAREASVEFAK